MAYMAMQIITQNSLEINLRGKSDHWSVPRHVNKDFFIVHITSFAHSSSMANSEVNSQNGAILLSCYSVLPYWIGDIFMGRQHAVRLCFADTLGYH